MRELDSNTIIVGPFNITLSKLDKTSTHKINNKKRNNTRKFEWQYRPHGSNRHIQTIPQNSSRNVHTKHVFKNLISYQVYFLTTIK